MSAGDLLHVFNVHLGTALIERRHQGRKLIAPELLSDAAIDAPRIVLGDFNEWTRGLATRLLRSQMRSADVRAHLQRSKTYPGVLPFLHLDHIYYDPALRLEKLALCRTRKALVASDHLPLIGEFSWEGERADANGPLKKKWFQVIQFPALLTTGMHGTEHCNRERRTLSFFAPR